MYRRIAEFVGNGVRHGRILSISESDVLHGMFDLSQSELVIANYPEYNLIDLDFEDGSFDFVVCDQVLEHVEGNLQQAIDEQYRVLRPGGWMILTTCFMNPIHGAPGDFWRCTPSGLKHLCRRFRHVEQAEGWGNAWVHALDLADVRGIPIPHAKYHPLNRIATHNDPRWPVMTWIIASK